MGTVGQDQGNLQVGWWKTRSTQNNNQAAFTSDAISIDENNGQNNNKPTSVEQLLYADGSTVASMDDEYNAVLPGELLISYLKCKCSQWNPCILNPPSPIQIIFTRTNFLYITDVVNTIVSFAT